MDDTMGRWVVGGLYLGVCVWVMVRKRMRDRGQWVRVFGRWDGVGGQWAWAVTVGMIVGLLAGACGGTGEQVAARHIDQPTTTTTMQSVVADITVPPSTTTTEKKRVTATTARRINRSGTRQARVAVGNDVWSALGACESGNNPSKHSPSGRYHGAFQFSLDTWHSMGMSGDPHNYSYAEQLAVAKRLQARSGWGQWPTCARRLGLL